MANIKKSLDYFAFDVDFFLDRKVKRLQKNFDEKGVMIYIYILTEIYRGEGYYLAWDSDYPEDIADVLGVNFNADLVNEVVTCCVNKLGLFNQELFNKYRILTSQGIQKRYLAIKEGIYKKSLDLEKIFSKYRLIGDDIEAEINNSDYRRTSPIITDNIQKIELSPNIADNRREKNRIEKNRIEIKEKEKKEKENIPPLSPQGETVEIQPNNILLIPESFKEETDSAVEIPEKLNTEKFISVWHEWEKYRKEKRQTLKPSTIRKQFEFLAAYDVETAIKIIEQSIMQGWIGLFELKANKSSPQQQTNSQNTGGLVSESRKKIIEEFLNGD